VTERFARHPRGGQRAEFAVHQGQQIGGRPTVGAGGARWKFGHVSRALLFLSRSLRMCSRVRPRMSFLARNGRPSGSVPMRWTGGMAGCWSWSVIRASSRNRRAAAESADLGDQFIARRSGGMVVRGSAGLRLRRLDGTCQVTGHDGPGSPWAESLANQRRTSGLLLNAHFNRGKTRLMAGEWCS
jgi:hypothetical protein